MQLLPVASHFAVGNVGGFGRSTHSILPKASECFHQCLLAGSSFISFRFKLSEYFIFKSFPKLVNYRHVVRNKKAKYTYDRIVNCKTCWQHCFQGDFEVSCQMSLDLQYSGHQHTAGFISIGKRILRL